MNPHTTLSCYIKKTDVFHCKTNSRNFHIGRNEREVAESCFPVYSAFQGLGDSGTHQNVEASRNGVMLAWSARVYNLPLEDVTVTSEIFKEILQVIFGKLRFKYLVESFVSVSLVQSSRAL